MLKISFPPIVNQNSKILLLGTMPGEKSLKQQEYYAHGRNQFWKLIFSIFNEPFTNNYGLKTQLLLNKGIALWDVLQHCDRRGSADNNISNETPNDFANFYQVYPLIKHVFFSSGKTELLYHTYVGKNEALTFHNLPSPSGANTWKTFDEKLHDWKTILSYLL